MRVFLLLILIHFIVFSFAQDINVSGNNERIMLINDIEFEQGALKLSKVCKALDTKKYKTKRIGKKGSAIFYKYCFKKKGLSLSTAGEEKTDICSSLNILFRKKNKRKFFGTLKVLNEDILWSSKFDDIFYSSKFKDVINKNIYSNPKNPNKTLIEIRYEGYSLSLYFNPSTFLIEEVRIISIFYDPKFKSIRT